MRTFIYSAVAAATLALAGVSSAFAQGQIIIINNNAPGVGFNDPTPARSGRRQPRPDARASSASTCSSTQRTSGNRCCSRRTDIFVQAQFIPLAPNVLGSAGATFVFSDFPGAEVANTWYFSALADHLAGADLNPGFADIVANFSTNFEFYFGFDNNEGLLVDLLPVMLHELGHGLGFANVVTEATGARSAGPGRHLLAVHARRHHEQELEPDDERRACGFGHQRPQGVVERHQREEGCAERAVTWRAVRAHQRRDPADPGVRYGSVRQRR